MEGQGRIFDVVVGEELGGVACCMGSGNVVLQCSATQCLTPEIKRGEKKKKVISALFFFFFGFRCAPENE